MDSRPAIGEVAARLYRGRQDQDREARAAERLIRKDEAARRQQWREDRTEPTRERGARLRIARAQVGVGERDGSRCEARQGLAQLAEQQPVRGRGAVRMRRKLAVEDVDRARGAEPLAQMVVAAAVPKAEPEHHAGQTGDPLAGPVQTGALCFEPAHEAVEARHPVKCTGNIAGEKPACRHLQPGHNAFGFRGILNP